MSAPSDDAQELSFLVCDGEMGKRIRDFSWDETSMGPVGEWPQSLRAALSICLGCSFPIAIYWGKDHSLLYNDAWSPILAAKHPWALGRPAAEVWPELWAGIGPLYQQVLGAGESIRARDQLLPMHRRGFTEECYFDYNLSPIRDETGEVGGIFNVVVETTPRVLAERRARLLRDLASSTAEASDVALAAAAVAAVFKTAAEDLPFSALYLAEADDAPAKLAVSTRLPAEVLDKMPKEIDASGRSLHLQPERLAGLAEGQGMLLNAANLPWLGTGLDCGPWPEPVQKAILHVLPRAGGGVAGFLICGLSPRLDYEEEYCGLLAQAARTVASSLDRVRALVAERLRLEKLAEIDRAKTAFFSNVSHEFRTPLTLMLSPLEELASRPDGEMQAGDAHLVEVAHRNALRLLRLVNALLDFSRMEAGRAQACYQPTDLSTFTADLASGFRSTMEKAGLRFIIDCPALPELVYVDRDMWEKVVLNLLSNAFKFTLAGEVIVRLRAVEQGVQLEIQDTGSGIPLEAQPHLFERFYRVQGAPGRTHEGSGIGLALVHDLVQLHGGEVKASSVPGIGTTFTVKLPYGSAHLPQGQVTSASSGHVASATSAAFVGEASRWIPDADTSSAGEEDAPLAAPNVGEPRPRVLLADDNADMRDYIARLLRPHFDVVAVADGVEALAKAWETKPDLVLSDVMMPRMDGIELLHALRAEPSMRTTPVILLSARAGEEARVEGVEQGADDYLVKPFSARELIARVKTHLELARVRADAEAELRRSEERYRAFIANSSEGIWRMEFDPPLDTSLPIETQVELAYKNGRLAECNEVMARMYGLQSPDDLVGCTLDTMLPSSDPGSREFLAAIIRGGYRATDIESEERDAEGNVLQFNNSMVGVVEDGLLKRMWGTQTNISERLSAEAALRESEARYKRLFDQSPLPTVVLDVETQRFVAANEAALVLHGYTEQEFITLGLADLCSKSEVSPNIPSVGLNTYASTLEAAPQIVRHRRKDNGELLVEVRAFEIIYQGRPALLVTFADVTARVQAEQHVKWLAAFPEHNPNPVIEVDMVSGYVFYANTHALRRFPDLESLGLRHPFLAGLRSAVRSLEQSGQQSMHREVCAEGNWYMQSLCYLPDSRHLRMYCTDITPLKRAESQLRENEETLKAARDEAERASRAKDNFLAMLSHELRTPLTPVLMTVASLEQESALPAVLREELAMMKRNIELETKLIDDLLDLSRIKTGKLVLEIEPVDINEAVRHVCGICRPQLHEKGVHLEADLDATALPVAADPARLQQVLWNVLKNAVKFTPGGGMIQVSTRQLAGARCEVRVTDSGVGIPEVMLPRIFDAFEQGDASMTRRFGGLGLGLAICKALVTLHQGTIRAESEGPGRGATFILELPSKLMTATARIRLVAPPVKRPGPPLRLLVVEDHPDTLRTLVRLLAKAGFVVAAASSVAEAVSLAEKETFDLLVSDLGLPDGDGFEVVRRIRSLQPVPAIAMSGYGTDEDVRRSKEAGFLEHLTKPVEFITLHRAIERLSVRAASSH